MSLTSRLLSWLWKLPPAETRDLVVERDLRIRMPDGAVLLADRHYARGKPRAPVILIRTPYGRRQPWETMFGSSFAERGFQVLIQSCRGTFGSGGDFTPFHHERKDGLATLAWLKEQPWFPGEMATFGASYVGFVQWAINGDAGPELKAMSAHVTSAEFRSPMYSGGSFFLTTALFWAYLLHVQEESLVAITVALLRTKSVLGPAFRHLPLLGAGELAMKKRVPFLEDWLHHDAPEDPWWQPIDFTGEVARVSAPVQIIGGWYDVFLPQTLRDYARLREAGKEPHLLIGPWFHSDRRWMSMGLRESLAFFRAHVLGDRSALRDKPVRIYVMGEGAWRDLPDWPPPHRVERWYLQPGRGLSAKAPLASEPDQYRYDPSDPTPTVGGSTLLPTAGARDNRAIEARLDVLVYSSEVLDRDVTAVGPLSAEFYVRSSLDYTDFFVRLCDVHPSGKSINVSDGLLRLSPPRAGSRPQTHGADGVRRIEIALWATAHRWKRGHRIRVQVSSGAHPRFVRNTGSGEPLATATRLVAADQRVFHDPACASAIVLPIVA